MLLLLVAAIFVVLIVFSMPIVFALGVSAVAGLWIGNGLGASGLTIAPNAGRLLAGLVLGRTPDIDLAPYDPRRPAAMA